MGLVYEPVYVFQILTLSQLRHQFLITGLHFSPQLVSITCVLLFLFIVKHHQVGKAEVSQSNIYFVDWYIVEFLDNVECSSFNKGYVGFVCGPFFFFFETLWLLGCFIKWGYCIMDGINVQILWWCLCSAQDYIITTQIWLRYVFWPEELFAGLHESSLVSRKLHATFYAHSFITTTIIYGMFPTLLSGYMQEF